jgi:hypothetical protein
VNPEESISQIYETKTSANSLTVLEYMYKLEKKNWALKGLDSQLEENGTLEIKTCGPRLAQVFVSTKLGRE